MKNSNPKISQTLTQWYQKEPGRTLARLEHRLLYEALTRLPGKEWVQIGDLDGQPLRAQSSQTRLRVLALTADDETTSLPAEQADVVMLLHVLEFYPNPLLLLREADRILRPGGHLLILGFNPFSLLGLRRLFQPSSQDAPWNASFYSRGRIKEWGASLNFEIVADPTDFRDLLFSFRPPWADSVYLLQARKRLFPLTPVGAPQRRPAVALTAKAASSSRTTTHDRINDR